MKCGICKGFVIYEPQINGFDVCEAWRCVHCSTVVFGRMIRGAGNSIPIGDTHMEFPIVNRQSNGVLGDYSGRRR